MTFRTGRLSNSLKYSLGWLDNSQLILYVLKLLFICLNSLIQHFTANPGLPNAVHIACHRAMTDIQLLTEQGTLEFRHSGYIALDRVLNLSISYLQHVSISFGSIKWVDMQETMAVLGNIESAKLILFFLMFNILNLFLLCLIIEGCTHMTSGTHGSQRHESCMNLDLHKVGNYLSYGLGT